MNGGLARLKQGKRSQRGSAGEGAKDGAGHRPTTGAKHRAEGRGRLPRLLSSSASTLCTSFPQL